MSWVIVDSVIDGFFGIDMILSFFMAYYDVFDDIVDSRKKIAFAYVRF